MIEAYEIKNGMENVNREVLHTLLSQPVEFIVGMVWPKI